MSEDDFQTSFWTDLEQVSTGLLAVTSGEDSHALPMTAHFDQGGPLYFYGPASGRLAAALVQGEKPAAFYYSGPKHSLFATMHGSLSADADTAARRRFWTPEVERWFPVQAEKDSVVLLRLDLERGEIWIPARSNDPQALDRHLAVSPS